MARKIKKPLKMSDTVFVRNMIELREHFNIEKICEFYVKGVLLEWLDARDYMEEKEKVNKLNKSGKDSIAYDLYKIFDVEPDRNIKIDLGKLTTKLKKLKLLKELTEDESILNKVECIAFSQDEFDEMLSLDYKEILLFKDNFCLDLDKQYPTSLEAITGIGKPNLYFETNHYDLKTVIDLKIKFDHLNLLSDKKISVKFKKGNDLTIAKDIKSSRLPNQLIYSEKIMEDQIKNKEQQSLLNSIIDRLTFYNDKLLYYKLYSTMFIYKDKGKLYELKSRPRQKMTYVGKYIILMNIDELNIHIFNVETLSFEAKISLYEFKDQLEYYRGYTGNGYYIKPYVINDLIWLILGVNVEDDCRGSTSYDKLSYICIDLNTYSIITCQCLEEYSSKKCFIDIYDSHLYINHLHDKLIKINKDHIINEFENLNSNKIGPFRIYRNCMYALDYHRENYVPASLIREKCKSINVYDLEHESLVETISLEDKHIKKIEIIDDLFIVYCCKDGKDEHSIEFYDLIVKEWKEPILLPYSSYDTKVCFDRELKTITVNDWRKDHVYVHTFGGDL